MAFTIAAQQTAKFLWRWRGFRGGMTGPDCAAKRLGLTFGLTGSAAVLAGGIRAVVCNHERLGSAPASVTGKFWLVGHAHSTLQLLAFSKGKGEGVDEVVPRAVLWFSGGTSRRRIGAGSMMMRGAGSCVDVIGSNEPEPLQRKPHFQLPGEPRAPAVHQDTTRVEKHRWSRTGRYDRGRERRR